MDSFDSNVSIITVMPVSSLNISSTSGSINSIQLKKYKTSSDFLLLNATVVITAAATTTITAITINFFI
jgi:CRISPR/Cas system-associated protein Cas7 (RAMP superfamily)